MYKTRKEVENWLNEMEIKNYVINEDLTVDVNEAVDISGKNLKEIPVNFRIIDGSFNCNSNYLTSLAGCPKEVNGGFYCSNNNLISLESCPEKVSGSFNCSDNELTSLEGCPEIINGFFDCYRNNLTSLKGCSPNVKKGFYCYDNKLISLEYCPEVIGGNFNCGYNKLTNFEFFPKKIDGNILNIYDNKIKEEELVNFNCRVENLKELYSDFNKDGNVEEFLENVHFYKSKKENELLKEISANSNNMKFNKKL